MTTVMRRIFRQSRPFPHGIRGLAASRNGATTVEFALIALPFFALLLALFELGSIFLLSNALETATFNTARQIRTGEMQTAAIPATLQTYKTSVCNQMSWLGSQCVNNLSVDVRTFPQFADTSQPSPVVNGQLNQANLLFQIGGPGDIVLVRTFYQWFVIAPKLDGVTQQLSNGSILITATATFRNEPFPTSP